jgi:hypothetical protein
MRGDASSRSLPSTGSLVGRFTSRDMGSLSSANAPPGSSARIRKAYIARGSNREQKHCPERLNLCPRRDMRDLSVASRAATESDDPNTDGPRPPHQR